MPDLDNQPAQPFPVHLRRKGQKFAILSNLFSPLNNFVVIGPMMVLFASDALGFNVGEITSILAILPLVGLLRIPALPLVEHFGKIKSLVVTDLLRALILVILLFWPVEALSFGLYVSLLITFHMAMVFGRGSVWQPLLKDLTTSSDRGAFFSRMRLYFNLVQFLGTGAIAFFVGQQVGVLEYRILLVFCLIFILFQIFAALSIPEKRTEPVAGERQGLGRIWKLVKGSPLLRVPWLMSALILVAHTPVFLVYLKQGLNFPTNLIAAYTTSTMLGASVSLLVWGRISDTLGFRPVLVGLHLAAIAVSPLFLFLAPFPEGGLAWSEFGYAEWRTVSLLFLLGVIKGSLLSGCGIAEVSLQHHLTDARSSLYVLAVFAGGITLVSAGVIVGMGHFVQIVIDRGEIYSAFGGLIHVDMWKLMELLGFNLTALAVIILVRWIPNLRPEFGVMDFFSSLTAQPLRILNIQKNVYAEDEHERLDTARWLGRRFQPLSIDPLIALADDPSYEVRLEAVRSLAFSRSPVAAKHLSSLLENPQHESLWGQLAWALAELQFVSAAPLILQQSRVDGVSARIRGQCLNALGRMGYAPAIEEAAGILKVDLGTPFLRVACCRVLLQMHAAEHLELILQELTRSEQRYDRFEIAALLCTWLGIENEWVMSGTDRSGLFGLLKSWVFDRFGEWPPEVREVERLRDECAGSLAMRDWLLAFEEQVAGAHGARRMLFAQIRVSDTWNPLYPIGLAVVVSHYLARRAQ